MMNLRLCILLRCCFLCGSGSSRTSASKAHKDWNWALGIVIDNDTSRNNLFLSVYDYTTLGYCQIGEPGGTNVPTMCFYCCQIKTDIVCRR
mmetsp:Transcript_736/g.1732  ORF Transcript_736/g.1732 Transcript_736/m.1732 type:complete len:91 (-) Transcript_736:218-490(-)